MENNFESIISIIKEIRNSRAKYNLPDNKKTSILFKIDEKDIILKENINQICKLAYGSESIVVNEQPNEKCVKIMAGDSQIFIPLGQLVDSEKEKEKLEKEIENLKFEINRSEKMLSNQGFIANAPKNLIENEQTKLKKNKEMLEKILKENNV